MYLAIRSKANRPKWNFCWNALKPCLPLRLKPLWVLVLPLLLSACTPDYGDSEWFTLSGYKSKGYTPYLSVRFKSPSKAWHCTDAIFSMMDGESYRARKKTELEYYATTSEDGLHYEVKFPYSYFQRGCEYRAEGVTIWLEENNAQDPQWLKGTWMRQTKIRDGEVGQLSLAEGAKFLPLLSLNNPPNPSYVLCRPWNADADWGSRKDVLRDAQGNPEKWRKSMECQPQDSYTLFGFGVSLTPEYLKIINEHFTLNILVEQKTYCYQCTPEALQETGWPAFDRHDQTAIAQRAVFEAFEQANGLKGGQ